MDNTVSVVIPAFNRKNEVLAAARSALDQTAPPLEVLIVDDGSTDGTREIDFAAIDPRIRLIKHDVNRGGGAARNTGIKAANGAWVALLDSDDSWNPRKLERQLEMLACSSRPEMTFGAGNVLRVRSIGAKPYNHRPPELQEDLSEYFLVHKCTLHTSTLIVPTALAQSVLFDERLKRHQDWDFVLRLQAAGASVNYIHENLAIYDCTQGTGRITSQNTVTPTLKWFSYRNNLITPRAKYVFYTRNWMTRHITQDFQSAKSTIAELTQDAGISPISLLPHIVLGFGKDFARWGLSRYSRVVA